MLTSPCWQEISLSNTVELTTVTPQKQKICRFKRRFLPVFENSRGSHCLPTRSKSRDVPWLGGFVFTHVPVSVRVDVQSIHSSTRPTTSDVWTVACLRSTSSLGPLPEQWDSHSATHRATADWNKCQYTFWKFITVDHSRHNVHSTLPLGLHSTSQYTVNSARNAPVRPQREREREREDHETEKIVLVKSGHTTTISPA